MSNLIYYNGELWHAEDLSDDVLMHYGVKGMKWGKRKSSRPEGVSRKTNRLAKRDAKEYTQAKMFYGESAGTRRKLIGATVKQRSKDPAYKKAFDHHVNNTDMARRAEQARGQRKRRNISNTVKKQTRGVANVLNGNRGLASGTTVAAVAAGKFYYDNGGKEHLNKAYNRVKSSQGRRNAEKLLRDALRNN